MVCLLHRSQVCICAGQLSQHVALAALQHGAEYKTRMINTLKSESLYL